MISTPVFKWPLLFLLQTTVRKLKLSSFTLQFLLPYLTYTLYEWTGLKYLMHRNKSLKVTVHGPAVRPTLQVCVSPEE